MTEDEILKAVTAKLTGTFYVGQRVRAMAVPDEYNGTVVRVDALIQVLWDDDPGDSPWSYWPAEIRAI